ncbi:MAG: DsbA family protein [Candidatus Polarisedimenticolia bacterium]
MKQRARVAVLALSSALSFAAGGPSAVERHSPAAGPAFLGPAAAPNVLQVYFDYQCPVCPRAARELERLAAEMAGALRIELRHYPLAMHARAFDAAAAAAAAQRQGRFWDYHARLLEERRFDRDSLAGLAAGLGLDRDRFVRDFDDAGVRAAILADVKAAQEAGVTGTPGFVINGRAETGWASYSWLLQIVKGRIKTPPAPP